MRIDPAYLDPETAYRLITGIVVPRPIAWVTSLGPSGVVNANSRSVTHCHSHRSSPKSLSLIFDVLGHSSIVLPGVPL